MAKMTIARIEKSYIGEEPDYTKLNLEFLSKREINLMFNKSFNYYNYKIADKTAKSWVIAYLKDNGYVDKMKAVEELHEDFIIKSAAWLCKMISAQNLILTNYWQKTFDKMINDMVKMGKEKLLEKKKPQKVKLSVADRHNNVISSHIANIENEIDNFINNNCKSDFSFSKYVGIHDIKPRTKKAILNHFNTQNEEYKSVINKSDKQLIEGYSNFSMPQMKRLIAFIDSFAINTTSKKKTIKRKTSRKKSKK